MCCVSKLGVTDSRRHLLCKMNEWMMHYCQCSGVNPFSQSHSISSVPVSNPFLSSGQMYVVPQSSVPPTTFTRPLQQPLPGYNVAPATGGQFVPPSLGQFNVPNGVGAWAATQPVIGQMPGQMSSWGAQPAPVPTGAAANPFMVSLGLWRDCYFIVFSLYFWPHLGWSQFLKPKLCGFPKTDQSRNHSISYAGQGNYPRKLIFGH